MTNKYKQVSDLTEEEKEKLRGDIEVIVEKSEMMLSTSVHALLKSHGFIGHLIQMLVRFQTMQIPTAAVAAVNNRYHLLVNPFFYSSLKIEEAKAVLTHEIYHLLNDHLKRGRDLDPRMWNVACLPPGQLISSVNKNIEDIVVGDLVMGQEGDTKVLTPIKQWYSGKVYDIKAVGCLPFRVTEEHPVLVKERKGTRYPLQFKKDLVFKPAKDINKKTEYVVLPKVKDKFDHTEIDLKKFIAKNTTGHHKYSNRTQIFKINLDEDLAWILGLYVAEGSKSNKNNNGVDFSLNSKEIYLIHNIEQFANKLGYKSRVYVDEKKPTRAKVSFSSTILSRAFEQWCGKGAHNKKIPEFILYHQNKNLLISFLEGYAEGDGHTNKKQVLYGTVSKTLALQIQLAYVKLGKFASVREIQRGERKIGERILKPYTIYEIDHRPVKSTMRRINGAKIKSTSYRWKDIGDNIIVPITDIKVSEYRGEVYNLTTESHTFCVNNIVTHNCDLAINCFIDNLPRFDREEAKQKLIAEHGMSEKEAEKQFPPADKDGKCCNALLPKDHDLPNNMPAEWYYKKVMQNKKLREKFGKKAVYLNPDTGETNLTPEEMEKLKQDIKDGKVRFDFGNSHEEWDSVNGQTKEILDEELRRMIQDAKDRAPESYGNLPGSLKEAISNFLSSKVGWRSHLRNWVQVATKVLRTSTRKRRSRRFGITYPGQKSDFKLNLGVYIDSSGSIDREDLKLFAGEINRIYATGLADIEIMIGDTETKEHYKMKKPLKPGKFKVSGFGGTNASAWLKYAEEHKLDALIVLTDGWFSYNIKRPSYPVLWALTTGGYDIETFAKQVKFGRVVKLEAEEDNGEV